MQVNFSYIFLKRKGEQLIKRKRFKHGLFRFNIKKNYNKK